MMVPPLTMTTMLVVVMMSRLTNIWHTRREAGTNREDTGGERRARGERVKEQEGRDTKPGGEGSVSGGKVVIPKMTANDNSVG